MYSLFRRKRKYPGLDPRTPITDIRYVVIDTELTGLDEKKDSIVSIGAVRMTGGRIELGKDVLPAGKPRTKLNHGTAS